MSRSVSKFLSSLIRVEKVREIGKDRGSLEESFLSRRTPSKFAQVEDTRKAKCLARGGKNIVGKESGREESVTKGRKVCRGGVAICT